MHHYSSLLLVGAALSLCSTTALPTPDGPDGPPGSTCPGGLGDHGYQYTVLAQNDVAGSSQVGDYSISGASGSQLIFLRPPYKPLIKKLTNPPNRWCTDPTNLLLHRRDRRSRRLHRPRLRHDRGRSLRQRLLHDRKGHDPRRL